MSDLANCQYCPTFGDCSVLSPPRGDVRLLCTREAGHSGDHVACNCDHHQVERWPNERERGVEVKR